jgi:hypothetical protein
MASFGTDDQSGVTVTLSDSRVGSREVRNFVTSYSFESVTAARYVLITAKGIQDITLTAVFTLTRHKLFKTLWNQIVFKVI